MKERLFAFRGPCHDFHVAESVLDIGRLEAAKLPGFGAFSILAVFHVLGELRPVIVGRPFGNHDLSLRPTISRMAAAAERASASAAKHSCNVLENPPALRPWAIWLSKLPALLRAAVARPRASALTGGLRLARGPGGPSTAARM